MTSDDKQKRLKFLEKEMKAIDKQLLALNKIERAVDKDFLEKNIAELNKKLNAYRLEHRRLQIYGNYK